MFAVLITFKAPGEAEADLAQLSQRGKIDAVYTDDSDALLFGAKMLIRMCVVLEVVWSCANNLPGPGRINVTGTR